MSCRIQNIVILFYLLQTAKGYEINRAGDGYANNFYKEGFLQRQSVAAVVNPGDALNDKDELWPCVPIPGLKCPYANNYTASSAPYKMVFYKGNVWLYAKDRATAKYWGLPFSSVALGIQGAKLSDWGVPYWNLYDGYTKAQGTQFDPSNLVSKHVTRMVFAVNSVFKPMLLFQNVTSFITSDNVVSTVVQNVAKIVMNQPKWGCDLFMFLVLTDGNLVATTAQNMTTRDVRSGKVPKISCATVFQSNSYAQATKTMRPVSTKGPSSTVSPTTFYYSPPPPTNPPPTNYPTKIKTVGTPSNTPSSAPLNTIKAVVPPSNAPSTTPSTPPRRSRRPSYIPLSAVSPTPVYFSRSPSTSSPPTIKPIGAPSNTPSTTPFNAIKTVGSVPTTRPTKTPTARPTKAPTAIPSRAPTAIPAASSPARPAAAATSSPVMFSLLGVLAVGPLIWLAYRKYKGTRNAESTTTTTTGEDPNSIRFPSILFASSSSFSFKAVSADPDDVYVDEPVGMEAETYVCEPTTCVRDPEYGVSGDILAVTTSVGEEGITTGAAAGNED